MKRFKLILFSLCILSNSFSQILALRTPTKVNPVVENFSGINCTFCVANDIIQNQLQSELCNSAIVNYHAGPFAIPRGPEENEFRTSHGNLIHDFFKIGSYPVSSSNRSSGFKNGSFDKEAKELSINNAKVNVGIKSSYDSINKKLKINVELFFIDSIIDTSLLNIYIMENNIKGYQLMPGGIDNFEYTHNNVFRKSLTSTWGIPIDKFNKNEVFNYEIETFVDRQYKIANLEVLSFVTVKDRGILNSSKIPALNGSTAPIAILTEIDNQNSIIANNSSQEFKYSITSNEAESIKFDLKIKSTLTAAMKYSVKIDNHIMNANDSIVLAPLESKDVIVNIEQGDSPGYGCVIIDCHSMKNIITGPCVNEGLKKTVKIKLGCGNNIIIANPSPLTDGRPNPIALEKSIYLALDAIQCNKYCDIKQEEMEVFNTFLDTSCPSNIFYLGGWGKPVITDSLVNVFERLIKAEKINLFVSGQDIALQMAGPKNLGSVSTTITKNFLYDYLLASYSENGDSTRTKVLPYNTDKYFGKLPMANIEPVYKTSSTLNLIPDKASTSIGGINYFLRFDNSNAAGFYGKLGNYKFVYTTVGAEMFMKDTVFLSHLINSVLNYFGDSCYNKTLDLNDLESSINPNIEITTKDNQIIVKELNQIMGDKIIDIIDLSGRVLYQQKINSDLEAISIPLYDISNGLIFVKIRFDSGQSISNKILKIQ